MSEENEQGPTWKCPHCGSEDLLVVVKVTAKLTQYEGNFETDVDDSDHEWGGDSRMDCRSCGFSSNARRFEVET